MDVVAYFDNNISHIFSVSKNLYPQENEGFTLNKSPFFYLYLFDKLNQLSTEEKSEKQFGRMVNSKIKTIISLVTACFILLSCNIHNQRFQHKVYDNKKEIFCYSIKNDYSKNKYCVPLKILRYSNSRKYYFSIPNSNYDLSFLKFTLKDLKKASIEMDTILDFQRTIIEIAQNSPNEKFSIWIKNNQFIYQIHKPIQTKNKRKHKYQVLKFHENGTFNEEIIDDLAW